MKILNLVYPDKSEIKYKINRFPDGQQNIVIMSIEDNNGNIITVSELTGVIKKGTVQIKSRLNNFLDLELIICTVASLRELGVKEIHLDVPYFLGSRSDRKFEAGGNNYLKTVICPIINSLNLDSVTVLDPHSDVLESCLNRFKKIDNLIFIAWVMNLQLRDYNFKNSVLVSPDAGASKKIYKLAEQICYKGDIITCSKDRDENGKLTKTIVPAYDTGPLIMKDYIIIDDICDGGATFINIAKELKKLYNCNRIYLIVTHSIFSKGFDELSKYFDGIYTTNSCGDIKGFKGDRELVKQMNIF